MGAVGGAVDVPGHFGRLEDARASMMDAQGNFNYIGMQNLLKDVAGSSNKTDAKKAAAMSQNLREWGSVSSRQIMEMQQAKAKMEKETETRYSSAQSSARMIIGEGGDVDAIQGYKQKEDEQGNVTNEIEPVIREEAQGIYNDALASATAEINKNISPRQRKTAKQALLVPANAQAIANVEIGGATYNDINRIASSKELSAVYEAVTGKSLPDSYEGARDALSEAVATNRIANSKAITEQLKLSNKAAIKAEYMRAYGSTRTAAMKMATEHMAFRIL